MPDPVFVHFLGRLWVTKKNDCPGRCTARKTTLGSLPAVQLSRCASILPPPYPRNGSRWWLSGLGGRCIPVAAALAHTLTKFFTLLGSHLLPAFVDASAPMHGVAGA